MGAVHGYLGMVTRLIVSRRPNSVVYTSTTTTGDRRRTHAAVLTDIRPTGPPEPEDLTPQLALLRGMLETTGATQAHSPDWEAEDRSGRCARAAGTRTGSRS